METGKEPARLPEEGGKAWAWSGFGLRWGLVQEEPSRVAATQSGASGPGWSPGPTCPHPDLGPLPLCLAFFTCNLGLMEAPMLQGCSEG